MGNNAWLRGLKPVPAIDFTRGGLRNFPGIPESALKQTALPGKTHGIFQFQQPAFHVEAVKVPLEVAAFANDPVTGYDDRDRVVSVGQAHGANSLWVFQGFSNGRIGCGMAVRDLQKFFPDGNIKFGGPAPIELEVKFLQLPFKIPIQLHHTFS